MMPTPAAEAFAAEVSLSFDRLILAADACGLSGAPRLLRVSAPTTFAMRWLIPRLDRFHAARPEAEVIVSTATTLQDQLRGGFELTLRGELGLGGAGHAWGAYRAVRFLDESDTLVVNLALLARRPLRTERPRWPRPARERNAARRLDRLARRGGTSAVNGTSMPVRSFFVTLQAVKDGLGFGVGPFPVLAVNLADHHLVAPFPDITVARPNYVALVPNDANKTPTLARSWNGWLKKARKRPDLYAPNDSDFGQVDRAKLPVGTAPSSAANGGATQFRKLSLLSIRGAGSF